MTEIQLPDKHEVQHTPESWQRVPLEILYPHLERELGEKLEFFAANVIQASEEYCGIVGDITGSAARMIAKPIKRVDQVHQELKAACSGSQFDHDRKARILRNGPDVDTKIRPSDNPDVLYEALPGSSLEESFEYFLFSLAEKYAKETVEAGDESQIKMQVDEASKREEIYWPIGNNRYMKITKGEVITNPGRRYSTIEIEENIGSTETTLAEFHMGYDPHNVQEDSRDKRSGTTVCEKMKMKIRVRGKDGKLWLDSEDINDAKARIEEPDSGSDSPIDINDPAGWLERSLRELRAWSFSGANDVASLEELLLNAALPDRWVHKKMIQEIISRNIPQLVADLKANPREEALISDEYIVSNASDYWWFWMSMANTGFLNTLPFFKGRIDVDFYHDMLTRVAVNTSLVTDPSSRHNRIQTPPYMRTMKWIINERQKNLQEWQQSEDDQHGTSNLMLSFRALQDGTHPAGLLVNDDVLDYMMHTVFSYLQENKGQNFIRSRIKTLGQKEFPNYHAFFNDITLQILENLSDAKDQKDFLRAFSVLEDNIRKKQATFNIDTLKLNEEQLDRLFNSGLITWTGGHRAIFTSSRIVSSIWEMKDTGNSLTAYTSDLLKQRIETSHISLDKDSVQAFGIKLMDYLLHKRGYPSAAAIIYHEPSDALIDSFIEAGIKSV